MAKLDVLRRPPVLVRWVVEFVAVAVFVVAVYEVVVAGALALWPDLTDGWILLLWITAATISGLGVTRVYRLAGAGVRRVWPASGGPSEALAAMTAATEATGPADHVLDEVASVLAGGTGARAAEVWVAEPSGALRHRGGAASGAMVDNPDALAEGGHVTPVSDADGLLGALVLRTDPRHGLTRADQRLTAEAANAVALLLRNRKLAAELDTALHRERALAENLARSRRRLVLARDIARERLSGEIKRRVERMLADCANDVDDLIVGAPNRQQILARLTTRVDTAVADFREIVHGFYPAALTDHGLAPSLTNLVAELPWPASCQAPDLPRLDHQIEMGVYFCLGTLIGYLREQPPEHLTLDLALHDTALSATLLVTTTEPMTIEPDELDAIADRVSALAGELDIAIEPDRLRVAITVPVERS